MPSRVPRLSHVLETSLYVADLDRSEAFYTRLFGFERLLRDDRMAAFAVPGGSVLLLFRTGGSTEPSPVPGGLIPPHDAAGMQHLCFAVPMAELDAWAAHLAQQAVPLESRVSPQSHGGTSLYFRDPDGHSLEVAGPGLWQTH